MNEDLLQYIWNFQLFNSNNLLTTNKEEVTVVRVGTQNLDSGPDFFNGQIRIGSTLWAGNIEIHNKSSDWKKHNHQNDIAYSRIILHVVWEDDEPLIQKNGEVVPTVELKGLVKKTVFDKYKLLRSSLSWIPCETEFSKVADFIKIQTIERKLVERLETKSNRLSQILTLRKNDWEATMYQLLAKYFGFKTNAVPFELLANSVDFKLVRKHRDSELTLLALFFGQAGFLKPEMKGDFPIKLQLEFDFLKNKYALQPLDHSIWKFMRKRPSNFPTIRIVQFCAIFSKNANLFQEIPEANSVSVLKELFIVRTHKYFDTHFRFDVPTGKKQPKNLGKSSVDILIINVIIPLLFNYGRHISDERIEQRAIAFLQEITWEKNSITKKWKELGMPSNSAFDSQALIQLKTVDCSNKKCLTCGIGNAILKPAHND